METKVFHSLLLSGQINAGKLSGLKNIDNGFSITFPSKSFIWNLVLLERGEFVKLDHSEFEFEEISPSYGLFRHKTRALKFSLQWRSEGSWAAVCRLGFEAGEDVNVASLEMRLPDRIRPCADHEEDVLLYPFKTGIRIPKPAEAAFQEFRRTDTAYGPGEHLRHLNIIDSGLEPVGAENVNTTKNVLEENLYDFRQSAAADEIDWGRDDSYAYPGTLSMSWMDYSGPNGGLYMAVYDPHFEKTIMFYNARRDESGIAPGFEKRFNRKLDSWNCDFVLGLHDGDWHKGAKLYRNYLKSNTGDRAATPDFFSNSPGTISHYDLKWEDGSINHRYADLPAMHKDAHENGFDNLLLAGWNKGGFDNYSLQYTPDPDLGTEQDLKQAISKIKTAGGKTIFYVNAMCIAGDSEDFSRVGSEYAVYGMDGKTQRYGEGFLVHPIAPLCPSVAAWRENIISNIMYVLTELGADGVYLDQIGSAPRECYAENHRHNQSWANAYKELVLEARRRLAKAGKTDYVLLTEYPMDMHIETIDCFLCYSFWQCSNQFCYPAMFRYTFPEVQVIDMVMQKPWAGRIPAEDKYVEEIFCRQFINGIKFWAYCHAPENAQLKKFFSEAITLYQTGVVFFVEAEYLDDMNITNKTDGILVREYIHKNKGRLYAVWNPTGSPAFFVTKEGHNGNVFYSELGKPEIKATATGKSLGVSSSVLSFVYLENEPKQKESNELLASSVR